MREKIVLASASPRRRELLQNAGFLVEIRPSHIPEVRLPGETPVVYVLRLARQKAQAAAWNPGEVIVGADTVVEVEGRVLEKPATEAEAKDMLRSLQGRWHAVHTGVAVRTAAGVLVDSATTRVCFLPMNDNEIDEYAASGEPMDKAGGYAIQGLASRYVDRVEGCYFNVVGLPVSLVARMIGSLNTHEV